MVSQLEERVGRLPLGGPYRITLRKNSMTDSRGPILPVGVMRTLFPELRRGSQLTLKATLVMPSGAEHCVEVRWRSTSPPYVGVAGWRCVRCALGLAEGDILQLTPVQQYPLRLHARRLESDAEPSSAELNLDLTQQHPPRQQHAKPAQPVEESVGDPVAQPGSPLQCRAVPVSPSDVMAPGPDESSAQALAPFKTEPQASAAAAPVADTHVHRAQQQACGTAEHIRSPISRAASGQDIEPCALSAPDAALVTVPQMLHAGQDHVPSGLQQLLARQAKQHSSPAGESAPPQLQGSLPGSTVWAEAAAPASAEPSASPDEVSIPSLVTSAVSCAQTSAMPDVAPQQGAACAEAAAPAEAAAHAEPASASRVALAAGWQGQVAVGAKAARSQDHVAQQEYADAMPVDDDLVDIRVPAAIGPVSPGGDAAVGHAVESLLIARQRDLYWDALAAARGCSRAVACQAVDVMADMRSSDSADDGGGASGANDRAGSAWRRTMAACWRRLAGDGAAGCSRAVSTADVAMVADVLFSASSIKHPKVNLDADRPQFSSFRPAFDGDFPAFLRFECKSATCGAEPLLLKCDRTHPLVCVF